MGVKSIVFVSRQAGTANAFVPVIKGLEKQNVLIYVFAYPRSEAIFDSEGIVYKAVGSFNQTLNDLSAIENLKLLITGTSFSTKDDSEYWLWGRDNQIVTAAFVDQWVNYEKRFLVNNEKIYPDRILVIDDYVRDIYLNLGIGEDDIVVTGNPCFENNAKQVIGSGNPNVIIFVSEPYSETHPKSNWNELVALSQLIYAAEKSQHEFEIIIRPHPRENLQKFRQHLALNHKSTSTLVTLSRDSKFYDLSKSGIVVGIKSILILEAFFLGRVTACILPNAMERNHFVNFESDIALLYNQVEVSKFLDDVEMTRVNPILNEFQLTSIGRFTEFVLSI